MSDSTARAFPAQDDFHVLPQPAYEEWRPVIGYETEYAVSNIGRVKRLKESTSRRRYPAGMILKPTIIKNGYATFVFRDIAGSKKRMYIHRVVMEAFVGVIPPKHEVNHINSKRDDNRLSNLEYVTRSGNNNHSYKKSGEYWVTTHVKKSMNDLQVREIRYLYDAGVTYKELAIRFNSQYKIIHRLVNRKTYRHVA